MIFLFSFIFSFFTFLTEPACRKNCIETVKATKQTWIAGTKNGGRGINYQITCVAGAGSDKLKVNGLWVDDQFFEVKAIRTLEVYPDEKFKAGDTIYILASRFIPGEPGSQPEKKVKAPIKYKGEGLLSYVCGGKKKKYNTIEKFEELERINMP